MNRRKALETIINLVFTAQHQGVPVGDALELELTVWGYALEDIPTPHLAEVFRRALRSKRDDYMLKTSALKVEWDNYQEELIQKARANAEASEHLQLGPGAKHQPMQIGDWKTKHNLPADWKLGQPYPPESDLYGVPSRLDGTRFVHDNAGLVTNPTWHHRSKKPWELYPNEHSPRKTVIQGVEWLWYVTVCVEADSPDGVCPGYVTEWYGPGGQWYRLIPCPDHSFRLAALTG